MVSDALQQELYKRYSPEVGVDLIEIIDETYLDAPIRLANNSEDIVSEGETFKACNMVVVRGVQDGNDPGETTLSIDDADQAILAAIEKVPPVKEVNSTIRYRFILASDPDTIEILEDMELKQYEVDETASLVLTVGQDNLLAEEAPPLKIIPATHPGLFTSEL